MSVFQGDIIYLLVNSFEGLTIIIIIYNLKPLEIKKTDDESKIFETGNSVK